VFRTSGTSGLFMQIAYDAKANDFLDAVYARALFATGYRPWHSIAYFWWDAQPKPTRLYERLGLMKKTMLPVDPDPEKQLAAIERLRPQAIYHFPSSLLLLARLLERRPVPSLRPRVVIAHGELMTDEQQVEIARAFGCPVFNQYGAQEFNRMGWDCARHEGMHEDADSVCIEIVEDERVVDDGETGELVVTGLVNELMPLVRYRIGDAGRRLGGDCPCGRGLPRFALTEGRLDDVLVLPDGRRIGPRTVAPKVEELRGFRQYRVEQKAADRVDVSIVKEADAPDEVTASVARVLRGVLGEGVAIDVKLVESIPLSRRGKLRKIVRRFAA
jgi:phenylacetate-coenzyme A ligase PaaK-like adenylate-forming protein